MTDTLRGPIRAQRQIRLTRVIRLNRICTVLAVMVILASPANAQFDETSLDGTWLCGPNGDAIDGILEFNSQTGESRGTWSDLGSEQTRGVDVQATRDGLSHLSVESSGRDEDWLAIQQTEGQALLWRGDDDDLRVMRRVVSMNPELLGAWRIDGRAAGFSEIEVSETSMTIDGVSHRAWAVSADSPNQFRLVVERQSGHGQTFTLERAPDGLVGRLAGDDRLIAWYREERPTWLSRPQPPDLSETVDTGRLLDAALDPAFDSQLLNGRWATFEPGDEIEGLLDIFGTSGTYNSDDAALPLPLAIRPYPEPPLFVLDLPDDHFFLLLVDEHRALLWQSGDDDLLMARRVAALPDALRGIWELFDPRRDETSRLSLEDYRVVIVRGGTSQIGLALGLVQTGATYDLVFGRPESANLLQLQPLPDGEFLGFAHEEDDYVVFHRPGQTPVWLGDLDICERASAHLESCYRRCEADPSAAGCGAELPDLSDCEDDNIDTAVVILEMSCDDVRRLQD